MTNEAKALMRSFLDFYYSGRPHGSNLDGACECPACEAWDAAESQPESVFTELETEVQYGANKPQIERLEK